MLAIFNVVFPIFALIFLGYLCRKRAILSANAASELNRFVIYLGLPALLFDSIARLKPADFSNLRFVAVMAIGIVAVFLLTAVIRYRQGAASADIVVDSLGTSYTNTGFIGIPLCLLAFGRDGMPPAVIATILTACLLFALAIVLLELCLHAEKHIGHSLLKTGNALIRNPILIAPVLGGVVAAGGWSLPGGVQQLFDLLGAAASPCALVSLGLFLAQPLRHRQGGGAFAGRLQAVVASTHHRRAGLLDSAAAENVGRYGAAVVGHADRYWSVHAGRALSARSGADVARHSDFHGGVAGDYFLNSRVDRPLRTGTHCLSNNDRV